MTGYVLSRDCFNYCPTGSVGLVAQSVQRMATGWTVRGSNLGGGEIFRNGYRMFSGGKERPGLGADPSHPSTAVIMKEQSYISNSPMGRLACTEPQCLCTVPLQQGVLNTYHCRISIVHDRSVPLTGPSNSLLGLVTNHCFSYVILRRKKQKVLLLRRNLYGIPGFLHSVTEIFILLRSQYNRGRIHESQSRDLIDYTPLHRHSSIYRAL